jgi:hypothetical protein
VRAFPVGPTWPQVTERPEHLVPTRVTLHCRGHLAMSGDIFDGCNQEMPLMDQVVKARAATAPTMPRTGQMGGDEDGDHP